MSHDDDDDDEGNDEGNYVENINRYSMTQARREIFWIFLIF